MVAASSSKQCKPMKIHTESLCCRERNDIPLTLVFLGKEYLSEIFQTLLAVPHFRKVAGKELKAEADVRRCSEERVLRNFTKFAGKHLCQSFFFTALVLQLY